MPHRCNECTKRFERFRTGLIPVCGTTTAAQCLALSAVQRELYWRFFISLKRRREMTPERKYPSKELQDEIVRLLDILYRGNAEEKNQARIALRKILEDLHRK